MNYPQLVDGWTSHGSNDSKPHPSHGPSVPGLGPCPCPEPANPGESAEDRHSEAGRVAFPPSCSRRVARKATVGPERRRLGREGNGAGHRWGQCVRSELLEDCRSAPFLEGLGSWDLFLGRIEGGKTCQKHILIHRKMGVGGRYERNKGHRYERSKEATRGSWPYY